MENPGVLYISYDGMTDPLGQSQVIPYLAGLSANHKLHLVSFEKNEKFLKRRSEIKMLLDQHEISWYPQIYTKKPPVLSTLYDIYKMNRVSERIINQHDIKIVHCRSYISSLTGLSLKRSYGKKFIFDMRGFWADERVDGEIWNLNSLIYKTIYQYFKKKERQFISEADHIISLTHEGKKEILSWKSSPVKEKVTVIPCCADLDHFKTDAGVIQKSDALKSALNLENAFVLSYLGSLGTWYLLDEMLDFFIQLKSRKPQSKFLFITMDDPELILSAARAKGIPTSDIVIKPGERKELPVLASISDVTLFFIKPLYSKKASSPTKMGELMGLGIPVIANNEVGDVEMIIRDTGAGIVISEFSDESYNDAIDNIDALKSISKEKIRKGSEKYYSLIDGVSKYQSVYKSLLSS